MRQKKPTISVSFLDLLSCSLGGMILLFLVFSALSHDGSVDSQQETGLPLTDAPDAQLGHGGDIEPTTPILYSVSLASLQPRGGEDSATWAVTALDLPPDNPPCRILRVAQAGSSKFKLRGDLSSDAKATSDWLVWALHRQGNVSIRIEPDDQPVSVQIRQLTAGQFASINGTVSRADGEAQLKLANGRLSIESRFLDR